MIFKEKFNSKFSNASSRRLDDRPDSYTETIKAIALPLLHLANHDNLHYTEFLTSPMGKRLAQKIEINEPLIFLLPAFPAKSSNREKTEGPAPDLGEYLALSALNEMCVEMNRVYAHGAKVIICSDGRVFNDLVMVTDEDLNLYSQRIRDIISRESLSYLSIYSLDDCHDILDKNRILHDLVERFGPTIEDIRQEIKENSSSLMMLNGIHRFMKEDISFHFPSLSKNQIMLKTKNLAYKVVQRSRSWDGLLKTIFPDDLRLSIHPYQVSHRKYGVKLVPSSDRWATPWHNVPVKYENQYQLMARNKALDLKAKRKIYKDIYVYYEV